MFSIGCLGTFIARGSRLMNFKLFSLDFFNRNSIADSRLRIICDQIEIDASGIEIDSMLDFG